MKIIGLIIYIREYALGGETAPMFKAFRNLFLSDAFANETDENSFPTVVSAEAMNYPQSIKDEFIIDKK